MCYRALTYIVEKSTYLFTLSNGKKKKSHAVSLEGLVFHVLDSFGFGA